jgi:microcystin-dependent protein
MAEPFLSEIRIMSFNFAPKGWAMCNGQLLPINQNQALFSLLGTTYGGNGQTNFALPNLQGAVPIHMGSDFTRGEAGGQTAHTLTMQEMTQHFHVLNATSTNGTVLIPAGNLMAPTPSQAYHGPDNALTPFSPAAVSNTGGSQAHNNMMPYLVLTFCIALQGIFPSQN